MRGSIFEGCVVSSGRLFLRLRLFGGNHASSGINPPYVRPKGFRSDGRIASADIPWVLGGLQFSIGPHWFLRGQFCRNFLEDSCSAFVHPG